MTIQVIIVLAILIILFKIFSRYKNEDITIRELIVWVLFWVLVAVAAIMPQRTDILAQFLGVERGADLLVYVSIIVLFFVVFKILVSLQRMEKNITKIVRKISIDEVKNRQDE